MGDANVRHVVGVRSDREGNRAVCSCGWAGPLRFWWPYADQDAKTHSDDQEGGPDASAAA